MTTLDRWLGLQESGETGQLWPPYPCTWCDGSAGRRDTGTDNCPSVNCTLENLVSTWYAIFVHPRFLSIVCLTRSEIVLQSLHELSSDSPLACPVVLGISCTGKTMRILKRLWTLTRKPSLLYLPGFLFLQWYWYQCSKVITTVLLGCSYTWPQLRTQITTVWMQITLGLDAQSWRIANHHFMRVTYNNLHNSRNKLQESIKWSVHHIYAAYECIWSYVSMFMYTHDIPSVLPSFLGFLAWLFLQRVQITLQVVPYSLQGSAVLCSHLPSNVFH